MLGLYSHGRGAFRKTAILGADAPQAGLYQVRAGDFVLNITFAWEGAIAVVGDQDDGWFVSGRFPTFVPDPQRCDIRFLYYYFRSDAGQAQLNAVSPGSAGRNRVLSVKRFLSLAVPKPDLATQREIVARLDKAADIVYTVRALQRETKESLDALSRSLFSDSTHGPAVPTQLRSLVSRREPDVTVASDRTYHFAGVYSFGRGVFVGHRKRGDEFAYQRLTTLRTGDFVYPKLMAWEGAFGAVPATCDGLVVSPEFPVFELDRGRLLPETLDTYFGMPEVWPVVAGISRGTNVRRRRLHPDGFLSHQFPLPPMELQLKLREVRTRVGAIEALVNESTQELDALLPALVDLSIDNPA
jgi:type I restriction enzyme S subunit